MLKTGYNLVRDRALQEFRADVTRRYGLPEPVTLSVIALLAPSAGSTRCRIRLSRSRDSRTSGAPVPMRTAWRIPSFASCMTT